MSSYIEIDDLREMLADIFDMDAEEIKDDSDFIEELGVDSLVALQLIVKVERKYGVKLGEEFMTDMKNLTSVHKMLNDKVAEPV